MRDVSHAPSATSTSGGVRDCAPRTRWKPELRLHHSMEQVQLDFGIDRQSQIEVRHVIYAGKSRLSNTGGEHGRITSWTPATGGVSWPFSSPCPRTSFLGSPFHFVAHMRYLGGLLFRTSSHDIRRPPAHLCSDRVFGSKSLFGQCCGISCALCDDATD